MELENQIILLKMELKNTISTEKYRKNMLIPYGLWDRGDERSFLNLQMKLAVLEYLLKDI